ncbi:ABC transporter permease [Devriesea agamarum]|uniref:ABC transporter permease n=1 Tax=Devriesea agamarum TaxID=472569 RepID=UPI00071E3BEE|nr:ABC transporter permease [Devriesea agamarum]
MSNPSSPTGRINQTAYPRPPHANPQRSATARASSPLLSYCLRNTLGVFRDGTFVFFTVALPIMLFILFNAIWGSNELGKVSAGTVFMVNMAAYGGLGAALNAGARIQTERASGWIRQLLIAGLSNRDFLIGKIVTASLVLLPALIGVFIAGAVVGTAPFSVRTWLLALPMLWVTLLPMILLGIVIGLFLRASAVQATTTIVLMLFAVAGGLWMPMEMLPAWLQNVGKALPTFAISEFGRWTFEGGAVPVSAFVILVIWTVVLGLLAMLGFRRMGGRTRG